jgi:nucleoside-diphosphate-sugar epimerase
MKSSAVVLVTGGTGAVGVNCILQLLQKGYTVRTTLRSLSKKDQVIGMLRNGGISSPEDHLSFFKADLSGDANWQTALNGCTYVLHVASPTHIGSEDESEMTRHAVDGVLRVLKTARDEKVKRVVLTSSFGALGFSNRDFSTVTTEANWTNPNDKGLAPYHKSKALAERTAWEFMQSEGGDMELAVINPAAIFGPSLGPSQSPSLNILKTLLSGAMPAVPNFSINVVDIRDVADLHIRAMTAPEAKGQRFIASADGQISMPEIAKLLKEKAPGVSGKVSLKILPRFVLRIVALFNPKAKDALYMSGLNRIISNEKAKTILGWTPIASNEEAILASVDSMVKFKMI